MIIVFAVLLAAIFAFLGVAKILAVPRMRELAAKAGFSTAAYRRIGVLEVAGAAGVALGPIVPVVGVPAAAGLLLLLGGAVITHLRHRARAAELAPAVVCAALVACYGTVLLGVTT